MVGSVGGVRTGTTSGGTGSSVSTTVANLRSIATFDGQLYVSTGSGSAVGIGTVGMGTPTSSGQATAKLPGFPTSGSPYEFVLADLDAGVAEVDTLYYTEDTASGGFIGKYSLAGGTWVSNGTITAATVRGLTASISGTTVSLYGSSGGSAAAGGGTVYSFVDATGYNSAVSGTATALHPHRASDRAERHRLHLRLPRYRNGAGVRHRHPRAVGLRRVRGACRTGSRRLAPPSRGE